MYEQILVAEDDNGVRSFIRKTLQKEGFQVTEAENGAEALRKLQQRDFDLVLTDIWMPELTGVQLLTNIQQMENPPKVIVITADRDSETLLTVIREQAYRFLCKPVSGRVIIDTVTEAIKVDSPPLHIEVVSATPEWVELIVPCDFDTIKRIHDFVLGLEINLPESPREEVATAFRELLLNAAEWGGKFNPDLKTRISCLRTERMILYRIRDPGGGFSMEEISHAAFANPDGQPFEHIRIREERGIRAGGFGIVTVKAMVDELIYNERRNEVVFIKYLS